MGREAQQKHGNSINPKPLKDLRPHCLKNRAGGIFFFNIINENEPDGGKGQLMKPTSHTLCKLLTSIKGIALTRLSALCLPAAFTN